MIDALTHIIITIGPLYVVSGLISILIVVVLLLLAAYRKNSKIINTIHDLNREIDRLKESEHKKSEHTDSVSRTGPMHPSFLQAKTATESPLPDRIMSKNLPRTEGFKISNGILYSDSDQSEETDKTVIFKGGNNISSTFQDKYEGLPYLKVLKGKYEGTIHFLLFKRITIGRDNSNTFVLNDNRLSKTHCEILFENYRFILKDNRSTNGTICNGRRIEEHVLNFGDTVKIGDTEMVFSCEGFDLMKKDLNKSIAAFSKCLAREPNFITALENLAFIMERDIARQKEAKPLWEKIKQLEQNK